MTVCCASWGMSKEDVDLECEDGTEHEREHYHMAYQLKYPFTGSCFLSAYIDMPLNDLVARV
jgi:hypothetical protein